MGAEYLRLLASEFLVFPVFLVAQTWDLSSTSQIHSHKTLSGISAI